MNDIIVRALERERDLAAGDIRKALWKVGRMEEEHAENGVPWYQRAVSAINLLEQAMENFDAVESELQTARVARNNAAAGSPEGSDRNG